MPGTRQKNTPGSSWLEDGGKFPTFGSAVRKAHARFSMTLDQKGPVSKKRRQSLCSGVTCSSVSVPPPPTARHAGRTTHGQLLKEHVDSIQLSQQLPVF